MKYLLNRAAVRTLPIHHKDPFDSIDIAIDEGLTLVTVDHGIATYPVPQWWG